MAIVASSSSKMSGGGGKALSAQGRLGSVLVLPLFDVTLNLAYGVYGPYINTIS